MCAEHRHHQEREGFGETRPEPQPPQPPHAATIEIHVISKQ